MAKKYYAVRSGKGGKGIYFTWEDCKRQVHGVAGAVYKSFPTLQEAQAFLKGGEDIKGAGFTDREEAPKAAGPGGQGRAVAYVDGSYDQRTGRPTPIARRGSWPPSWPGGRWGCRAACALP